MENDMESVFSQFNLGEHVMVSSRHIKKLYMKMCAEAVQEDGLTQNEIDVILFLWKYASHDTAKEIAKYRCMSKSMVCKSVESLTSHGYLEAIQDCADRRYLHLKLSQQGRETVVKLQKARDEFLRLLQRGVSQEEMDIFLDVLSRIRSNARKEVEMHGKCINMGSYGERSCQTV